MPELPEVETVVRGLRAALTGRTIVGVEVRWGRSIALPDPPIFVRCLCGRRILQTTRRGKWAVLSLDEGQFLLVHLGMSGRLVLELESGSREDPHARVILSLDNGQRVRFSDPRKFGRLALTRHPEQFLGDLGPEPLDEGFTIHRLLEMLRRRRARLKPLLMDQRFLAGLGNIYTDEVLWRARLHPLRCSDTLSPPEAARLHQAIQQVLEEAIGRRGTTLKDARYVGPDEQPGEFAERLAVYGRAGQPCPRCSTPIVRLMVGGRGTHLCPTCQPA